MSFFDIDLALYLIPIPLEAEAADRNDARMEDQLLVSSTNTKCRSSRIGKLLDREGNANNVL